ncbi:hypothetical protein OD757_16415 [Acinetobacter sp. AYS6]|uniref:hypothetical protein n=1 Tax=Acinetobacter sp. AYS6 TaxID=2983297 RepID=UPI0021D696F3|nr:hypothetical protein [Acinetobacter sp. AYS6]MCU7698787.1 hypothetical protein [Acinetobacter sp. AYS6]
MSEDNNRDYISHDNLSIINTKYYHNNLLNIHRSLLLMRNVVIIETDSLNFSFDLDDFLSEIEKSIFLIKEFPLYFPANEAMIELTREWIERIEKVLKLTSGNISHTFFNESGFLLIKNLINDINSFFEKYSDKKNTHYTNDHEYRIFVEMLRGRELSSDNALEAKKLSDQLEEIKNKLNQDKELSQSVKDAYEDIKRQHSSFNAFIEQNYNNATKKIYDEIFNTENTLANEYRSYAIKVFGVVALIACITFITPWWFGVLHWTRTYKFVVDPVDTLFFVKSLFMFLLTAPGWYFARESAKHRQVAYKAKIISAELSALPYYIADLNEEKRHEMRIKMADKFFGQELYNDKKSDNSNVNEQTKATTEAIKTINALLGKANKPGEGA